MALRLIRALPGERPFLPPLPAGLTAGVAPGSRRQDHTISPYAAAFSPGAEAPDAAASIATRPTFRDDREAPLMAARAEAEVSSDLRNSQESDFRFSYVTESSDENRAILSIFSVE